MCGRRDLGIEGSGEGFKLFERRAVADAREHFEQFDLRVAVDAREDRIERLCGFESAQITCCLLGPRRVERAHDRVERLRLAHAIERPVERKPHARVLLLQAIAFGHAPLVSRRKLRQLFGRVLAHKRISACQLSGRVGGVGLRRVVCAAFVIRRLRVNADYQNEQAEQAVKIQSAGALGHKTIPLTCARKHC